MAQRAGLSERQEKTAVRVASIPAEEFDAAVEAPIARWIELEKQWRDEREKVSPQVVAKPDGGRPESGTRAAARELGINREDARRAEQVASLSDEAKEAAREVGTQHRRW